MRLLLLSLLLAACSAPPPPTEAVIDACSDVRIALDDAVQHHKVGEMEQARRDWRSATATWHDKVEPGLMHHLPHDEAVRLTHRLALIRRAIDQDGGDPSTEVGAMRQELDRALERLPR